MNSLLNKTKQNEISKRSPEKVGDSQKKEASFANAFASGWDYNLGDINLSDITENGGHRFNVQPKLQINQPGDRYEQEADAMADKVMRMSEKDVSQQSFKASHTAVQRKYAECETEDEEKKIQRKENNNSSPSFAPPIVHDVLNSPSGKSMDYSTRSFMESRFKYDFSNVKIHDSEKAADSASSISAMAYTSGKNIVFNSNQYRPQTSEGKRLLAHELAHVTSHSNEGLFRTVTPNYSSVIGSSLRDRSGITSAGAHNVLSLLNGLSPVDLFDTLVRMERDSYLIRLLHHISAPDLTAFNTVIQRILQRIQRTGVVRFAQRFGLKSQAELATVQSRFMVAQNTATATATFGPTPTTAQVSAQQTNTVASTSIAPTARVLSPADEATQTVSTTAAVASFITWATANHPALHLTAANLRVDVRGVFNRGENVVAFGQAGKAVIGNPFAIAVAANPAYVLAVIIHELHGHPQYGPYGQPGVELGLELYDQAAAIMPGYVQPAAGTADRRSEIDAYGYQETEIYSLMISLPFYTPVTAADAALSSVNFDPGNAIVARIGLIKTQFEDRVARSLLRGLVLRFRADPRIDHTAVAVFEGGIRHHYSTKQAGVILH